MALCFFRIRFGESSDNVAQFSELLAFLPDCFSHSLNGIAFNGNPQATARRQCGTVAFGLPLNRQSDPIFAFIGAIGGQIDLIGYDRAEPGRGLLVQKRGSQPD